MSFNINLYTFAKDSNSTAQPTGSGTQLSCNILSPADIIAPLVEIKSSDPTAFNYAYIAAFHRYYFIEGITYNEGLWILNLRCDVLATYKTEIGAQSLYVLRAASAYDGDITDNYYPPTADYSYSVDTQSMDSVPGPYSSGYYVLNIAGVGTTGNSTLYQLTPTSFRLLLNYLYAAIGGLNITEVVPSVVKFFGGNPEKLVNSAMWFPFPFSNTVSLPDIHIGNWSPGNTIGQTAIPCEIITNPLEDLDTIVFTLSKHPQASTKGSYLNLAPFSNYTLFIPGAGAAQLDSSKMLNSSSITIYRTVDAITGQMLAWVRTNGSTTQLLAELTGQWGVPLTLNGSNNGGNILTGAVSTIGAAFAGAAGGGIIGATTAGIGSMAASINGATVSTGSGGSAVNIYQRPVRLDSAFYRITGEDNTHNGRPLMQTRTISTLSGFIMVQKGDVPIAGTSQEADEIRSLLEGGFYYE